MDIGFQTTIDYGGLGRYSIGLVRELGNICDQITVYPTPLSVENPSEHEWWTDMPDNVNIVDKKSLFGSFIRDFNNFRYHDLVHVNYASLGMPALFSKLVWGTPVVYTLHHYDDPRDISSDLSLSLKYFIDLKICLPVLARTSEFVTVSEYNSKKVQRELGRDAEVIYHGIDPSSYQDVHDTSIRAEYEIGNSSEMILFVGKLHSYKDISTLLRAFDQVHKKKPSVELVIISGGGEEESKAHEIIQTLEIGSSITFIKKVDDRRLLEAYDEADVFCMPSYNEAFGLVFLEAMASNTPIVYVDEGAAPEVVNESGIPVQKGNAQAMSDAIIDLLEGKITIQTEGAERVEQFSWEAAASDYLQIYKQVTNKEA